MKLSPGNRIFTKTPRDTMFNRRENPSRLPDPRAEGEAAKKIRADAERQVTKIFENAGLFKKTPPGETPDLSIPLRFMRQRQLGLARNSYFGRHEVTWARTLDAMSKIVNHIASAYESIITPARKPPTDDPDTPQRKDIVITDGELEILTRLAEPRNLKIDPTRHEYPDSDSNLVYW